MSDGLDAIRIVAEVLNLVSADIRNDVDIFSPDPYRGFPQIDVAKCFRIRVISCHVEALITAAVGDAGDDDADDDSTITASH